VHDLDSVRRALEERRDVRLVYLFGSAARGEARSSSDVDVAILFAPLPEARDLDALAEQLGAAAQCAVDLVVLNTAPPLLAHEIVATGRPLLCRDEDERLRFVTRAIARYLDTAHLRAVQHAYLRERVNARRARPA
jgi:predicted nucleotidyltransferase